MIKYLKAKLQDWLKKRPPKFGPDTLRVIAEDFRKAGLGLVAMSVVGFMQVVAKFSTAGSIILFVMDLVLWGVAIVIHSIYERMNGKALRRSL